MSKSPDTFEKMAGIGSIIIVIALIGYWGFQVNVVMEMLELAYG